MGGPDLGAVGRAGERPSGRTDPLRTWRQSTYGQTRDFHRFLLVDAPLSPLRTGRQPQVSDRDPSWQEQSSRHAAEVATFYPR